MGRKSSSEEPERPHRLSLAELAAHDDACSDAMVDNAFFKSQIRKNRTKYNPLRGIKGEEVPQILLHKVIVDKDLVAAEKALLKLPGIKRYRSTLRSKPEQENFKGHLRKYIAMYSTDCPWEVSTTNRYTITTYEAAVTARQRVKQGQVIKYLTGTLVPLTTAESADLDLTNRNFSIVVSSRKKNSSIFLGPARFANHDCDANGRLVTRGADGMEVMAVKNIEVGDEITVSYGDDYFGPGNQDCLCHTCERLIRNAWAGARMLSPSRASSQLPSPGLASPEPGKGKRKRGSELLPQEVDYSRPIKSPRNKSSPSKLANSWTPPADSYSAKAIPDVPDERHTHPGNDGSASLSAARLSPPSSPSQDTIHVRVDDSSHTRTSELPKLVNIKNDKSNMAIKLLGNLSTDKQCPSPVSAASASDADASLDPDTIVIKVESVETNKIETDAPASMIEANQIPSPVTESDMPAMLAVTNLTTTEITKTTTEGVGSPLPSIEPTVVTTTEQMTTSKITVQSIADFIRIPGDYILTRKLLAQPHDRWVQCHNERCHSYFIQPNGYQTRRECPRCERHSMLYGFSWPKTDPDPRKVFERAATGNGRGRGKNKTTPQSSAYRRAGRCGKGTWVEGGGDEEERVMDHRTVHRFVLPEDERATTRKGLLKMAEKARTDGDDFDMHERGNVGHAIRTESVGFDSDRSLTPDGELRRRSNRFVATKVYTDA